MVFTYKPWVSISTLWKDYNFYW